MSVDPTTLTDNTTKSLNSYNIEWNSTIITNITCPQQLETQCINNCKATISTCPCIQRILFIMRFYSIWIDMNSSTSITASTFNKNVAQTDKNNNNNMNKSYISIAVSEFINNLKYYSIVQLTNDWHHLREQHWININSQSDIRNLFQSIITKCNDLNKCRAFKRMNRDRSKTKNIETRKQLYFINNHYLSQNDNYNESIEVITQQICDSIHDLIFHSPIIAFPAFSITKSTDNKTDDDNDDDIDDDIDESEVPLLRLLSDTNTKPSNKDDGAILFEERKKALKQLNNGSNNYYKHSKFVTNMSRINSIDSDIENVDMDLINSLHVMDTDDLKINMDTNDMKIDDDADTDLNITTSPKPPCNMTNNMGSYEFGVEMMYSDHYKTYAKFGNIKEEATEYKNTKYCLSINQWQDTVNKAKQYIQCTRGKAIKAINKDEIIGINIDDKLNIDGLISCLLYTNFTDLQRKFSDSTRRYSNKMHETDDDLRIKHYRDYFYWGRTLMITIKCYGDRMNENRSFYHGINTELVFADFTAYFNCPTSTTISLVIASSFASNAGIILKLSARYGIKTKTKYMDVSWFSDYPNEEERLFYGYHNELEIVSIFKGTKDYKKYIRAIKVLDMLTDSNIGGFGRKFIKKYAKLSEHKQIIKYLDYLQSMIIYKIDNNGYNEMIKKQKEDKKLNKKKNCKIKIIPRYMMDIFNYFCKIQQQINIDTTRFFTLYHEISNLFILTGEETLSKKYYSLNLSVLSELFPNTKYISFDFGFPGKYLQNEQYDFLCKTVTNYLNECSKNKQKKCMMEAIEVKGLIHKYHLEKHDKQRIKNKYNEIFLKWNVKIDWLPESVNFKINYKKKTMKLEHFYVGNFYIDGFWEMFVSISKDKLIKPKTIKQVIYHLNSSQFETKDIKVKKSPFYLKRKALKSFKIDITIIFNKQTARKDLHCWHLLDFKHFVTMIDVFFDTNKKKDAKNDVFNLKNYQRA